MALKKESARDSQQILGATPFLLAVDDGHNDTDVLWYDDGAAGGNGVEHLARFESSAIPGKRMMDFQGDSLSAMYDTEGQSFTCGPRRLLGAGLDTRTTDYPLSPLNRVLVAHAMRQAGIDSGTPVALATGLPLKEWMGQGREVRRQGKIKNLALPVTGKDGWERPTIVWQDVYPEAISAYVYGRSSGALPAGNTAVIDIGGRTTDIAVVIVDDDGVPAGIDIERSGSEEFGVLQMRDVLGELLASHLRVDSVDGRVIDQVFAKGTAMIYGESKDFSDLVAIATRNVRTSILNAVRHRLGSGTDFSSVWVVGGGAHMIDLSGGLPEQWHVVVAKEPEFANVRGMYIRMRQSLGLGNGPAIQTAKAVGVSVD